MGESRRKRRIRMAREILESWGIEALSITPVKDAMKVVTEGETYCLKVAPLKPRRIALVHSAVTHLVDKGFGHTVGFIPTLDGRPYIFHEEKACYLTKWIESSPVDFRAPGRLARATNLLALVHEFSKGFTPPPGTKALYRSHRDAFERRARALLEFRDEVSSKRFATRFETRFLEEVDFYYQCAMVAVEILKTSNYGHVADQAAAESGFCHGDPAARNFVITASGNIHIIDFDSVKLDLWLMDLARFMRRTLKKCRWDFSVGNAILAAYGQARTIGDDELTVLLAFLTFPQKFWRICDKYFGGKHRWRQEKYMRKLSKALNQKPEMIQFLTKFCRHYRDRLGIHASRVLALLGPEQPDGERRVSDGDRRSHGGGSGVGHAEH